MLTSLALVLATRTLTDPLEASFLNPPLSAKPHTWWHWMNGNVTREGITADLEAMKEVGIGGAQMFTVDQGIPAGPAGYMSPRWRELTAFAVKEASRLGLELCLHNCAGWSSSGGPWIEPADAMQVLAWSELKVEGPKPLSGSLPQPVAPAQYRKVDYSRDIAVYAFRTPETAPVRPKDFLARTGVERGDGLVPELGAGQAVQEVVDLTSHFKNGHLDWDVPEGKWTILRIGHVPTGKDNHPAPLEGDGLEVDKLSRQALDKHWSGVIAKVLTDVGPHGGKALNNALIDSYEVGSQNWTPKFREEFQKRRGYDPLPYLPVIAGYTVQSTDVSERFLWDFRRTIADLYADNYFGYFGELCRKAGLKFSTEPYGNGGFDNFQSGSTADIPMGEFWADGGLMETAKLASSIGHVYGRPIIGAESFTADEGSGRWLEEPYRFKVTGDRAFCEGINRYIFHRYAMQPWVDVKPGMTMGPWGTHLDRTQTWWTEAKEWMRYVTRSQSLLQQGRFVADVAYFTGEGAPADLPSRANIRPEIPAGFSYDGVDTAAVFSMSVRNGRVVLPSGMTYAVLVLPESKFMTEALARKISTLVEAGATVVGSKPEHTPSLSNYPASENNLTSVADRLWGAGANGIRPFGKGRIATGVMLQQVFAALKIGPDFQSPGANLMNIHRKIRGADVYFVSNQRYRAAQSKVSFRVTGEVPELWHPDTGKIEMAPAYENSHNGTSLDLYLKPAESVFVVFRKPAPALHLTSFQPRISEQRSTSSLKVQRAFYGTGSGAGADVTSIVAELIASGETDITASNALFGDTVFGQVKELQLDYTVSGKPKHLVLHERDTAELLPASASRTVNFVTSTRRDGQVDLVALAAEDFTYGAGRVAKRVKTETPRSIDLGANWDVSFPPNLGAPAKAHFAKLISWPEHSDAGIRYFSGSGTYVKEFELPKGFVSGGRAIWLDLGEVKNFATVSLNGKAVATIWKPPFALDITSFVKPGQNRLTVKVTNLWPNRIIGDEQLPAEIEWDGSQPARWPTWLTPGKAKIAADRPMTGRITFATWKYFDKNSPLYPSGLIGPVKVLSVKKVVLGVALSKG